MRYSKQRALPWARNATSLISYSSTVLSSKEYPDCTAKKLFLVYCNEWMRLRTLCDRRLPPNRCQRATFIRQMILEAFLGFQIWREICQKGVAAQRRRHPPPQPPPTAGAPRAGVPFCNFSPSESKTRKWLPILFIEPSRLSLFIEMPRKDET